MTRILLVEDDEQSVQAVVDILRDLPGKVTPIVASNKDQAILLLAEQFFDLLILDLTIPSSPDTETRAPEFGFEVFGQARLYAPGMPIYLLTGSSVEKFVPDLLRNAERVDIWGSGKVTTVSLQKKLTLDDFSPALKPFVDGSRGLEDVELRRNDVVLTVEDERLLRIFAKRYQGTRCEIWELSGGLSSSKVLRVKIFNSAGGVVHHAAAKIAPIGLIQDEQERYTQYVARLAPAVTPRLLITLEFGAKATGAVFYSLADGHDISFFQAASNHHALCATAVAATAEGLRSWRDAGNEGSYSVAAIRRRTLEDAERDQLLVAFPLDWTGEYEQRSAQANWGCVHGDCHGKNILLTVEGVPAIIDYGDVGPGPLSMDPIALEFSLFFHPDGPLHNSAWPSEEAAENWGDLEGYLTGCPCPDYIRACRSWANKVAAGQREIAASAYSYFLRQLKYPQTNKKRALALLEGTRRLWDST